MLTQPPPPPPTQPLTPIQIARAITAINLQFSGKLTDSFLPPNEYKILMEKPFPEWPKEMQDKLIPFGASMIREEPPPATPSPAPGPDLPSSPPAPLTPPRPSQTGPNTPPTV